MSYADKINEIEVSIKVRGYVAPVRGRAVPLVDLVDSKGFCYWALSFTCPQGSKHGFPTSRTMGVAQVTQELSQEVNAMLSRVR